MTKKPQQTKDERRAEHNAIERARRESLNTKFQQLAHLLPNLQNDTRPSKSTIIERTLEFVKQALQKEERYRHELRDLRHTNRQLLNRLSDPAPSSNVPSVSSEPMHYPSASPSPFMLSLTPTPTMPAASLPTSSMSTMSSMSSSCVALDPSYCDPSTQHHPTACDPILFGQLPLQAMVGSPCESEEELNELDLQHHHNSMMNYAHHLQMYSQDHNAKATSVPFASPSISMPLFQ
ncbi:uncharacterized protein BYT42DRAFT_319011 [Radiomyces spectabilis]|uniref:uncharacterized protein n=1 Tax=Radiomyces spectabilis TaxID=64574 RepID=UPI0022204E47|nr:uncharacterized protein BYT42DRAFT_319011 [Radiomyces spectabilis]KAI8379214.1 hypothetical protein BYT42DRAFT_319011 [Radiomyces spectabilis]